MEILLATNNRHKAEEFSRILQNCRVLCPAELGIDFDYQETGSSFLENSLGKALTLYRLTGKTVIADDSGLCVTALGDAPGIYSARYGMTPAGRQLSAAERNNYLLKQLQHHTDRQAFFVCCMVLVFSTHRFFTVQETVEGVIAREPAGDNGFGYDPVFFIPHLQQTIAQLDAAAKDKISHRGKAARALAGFLAATRPR